MKTTCKILIVDDDLQYRELVGQWLSEIGHKCVEVEDGQKAIECLTESSFDLLVTDMMMPNVDGLQLLQYIKREKIEINVIVMTGFSKKYSFVDIFRAGADDFIEKPLEKDVLYAKIAHVIRMRQLKKDAQNEFNTQQILIALLNLSIESKDVDELLHEFLSLIITFPYLDLEPKGAVFLVDDIAPDMLVLKSSHNLADPLKITCANVPFGRCLCGKAALQGETIFVNHVDSAHDNRFTGMDDHGHYCTPIISDSNKLLGVFTLYTKAGVTRDSKVENVLNAAANILARIIKARQNEADIVQHELRFKTMTESIVDAIILMDHHGRVSFWNPAAERVFGFTSQEIIGKNLHELIVPDRYRDKYLPALHKFFQTGQGDAIKKTIEVSGLCKSGREVPLELSLSPLKVRGTWQAVGIIRDISQRKKLEMEKDDLNNKLRQAHKMEAIGTLAGGIAHDFNNILGAIIGFADMAMDDVPPESLTHKDLSRILTAGNRAKDLVSQILTFSRQKEEEFIPVKIQHLLKEAMKLLRASIPMNIEIVQKVDEDCSYVLADPTQIHQVVMNLCTNAYYAMQNKGGVLSITLKNRYVDAESSKKLSLEVGHYVVMSVSDTGSGMDSALLSRIFDPFYTTKPQGEGTGMGLSLVHGIIAEHGGVVNVTSEPNKGSKFDVYFLAYNNGFQEISTNNIGNIVEGDEHILLVDDELALLEVSARKLQKWGYTVTTRASSIEALEAFKATPDKFDMVITDLAMPNMTGLDMAIEMLKFNPDIPIVLSTGFVDQRTTEYAMRIGIKKIVNKPVSLHEISLIIRKLLPQGVA